MVFMPIKIVSAEEEFDKDKFLKTVDALETELMNTREKKTDKNLTDNNVISKTNASKVSSDNFIKNEADADPVNSSYYLKKGDGLKIDVYKEKELSGEYDINESGSVSFPLISSVDAVGKTEDELAEEISKRLKKYLKDPKVSVRKDLTRSALIVKELNTFSILGEVRKPGEYEVKEGLTLSNAIAISGGFTPTFGDSIKIVRTEKGVREIKDYSSKAISEGLVDDPLIIFGDKIIVNEQRTYFTGAAILGKVQKPGIYDSEDGLTLIRLIAQAGGLSATADARKIRVVRDEDGKITIKNYDLNKILSGQIVDPEIIGGDKIYIEESFF